MGSKTYLQVAVVVGILTVVLAVPAQAQFVLEGYVVPGGTTPTRYGPPSR